MSTIKIKGTVYVTLGKAAKLAKDGGAGITSPAALGHRVKMGDFPVIKSDDGKLALVELKVLEAWIQRRRSQPRPKAGRPSKDA